MTKTPAQMRQPAIETERLTLVMPEASHLPAYVSYCASRRSGFVGGPYDAAKAFEKFCGMAGHWTMRGFGRYVMTLKSTGQPIGHVGALQIDAAEPPEMTWTLWADAVEGQGYAFEAATAYLNAPQNAYVTGAMLIRIDTENQRSLRLAHRIGAKQDEAAQPPKWMPNAVTFRVEAGRPV